MHGGGTFALAKRFWGAVSAVIRSRVNVTGTAQDYWTLTKAFALGDQDILNIMFQRRSPEAPWGAPEWLYLLPQEYNWCIDPPFLEDIREDPHGLYAGLAPLDTYTRRPPPCIIHYCGNRLMSNDAGKEFLDVRDPIQASFMWVKHWPLERPEAVCLEAGPSASPPPLFFPPLRAARDGSLPPSSLSPPYLPCPPTRTLWKPRSLQGCGRRMTGTTQRRGAGPMTPTASRTGFGPSIIFSYTVLLT
jgi:hypothetical protein